jgi:hypothetical protein
MKPSPEANIYSEKMSEAIERAKACRIFLDDFKLSGNRYQFDSAVLQFRKSLECMVYCSIAPNKKEYEEFRQSSEKPADFRKDYNATKILTMLGKINADFYPQAAQKELSYMHGHHHFSAKKGEFLTKRRFIAIYDRLGKFLHADNPWSNSKGINNLVVDIDASLNYLFDLLKCHIVYVKTRKFIGIWLVEVNIELNPCLVEVYEAERAETPKS